MRWLGALLAASILCPAVKPVTDWTVSLRGAGPIQMGMSLAEVRQALGDATARLAGEDPEAPPNGCAYLESKAIPEGLDVMFDKGRAVRISVSSGPVRTSGGAGIGDSEERIKQLYAGIRAERNHYIHEGHYLKYTPASGSERGYGMVFETDGRKVTAFRSGTLAAIALAEGCS